MNLRELKIGNYVVSRGEVTRIIGVRTDTDNPTVLCENCDVWVGDVGSIKLTKDILTRLGFGMSDDNTYGLMRTVFYPFGKLNVCEYEDYLVVDLAMPQSCIVKHQYIKEHENYPPSLLNKSFEGEIVDLHELQNVMETVGCIKKLELDVNGIEVEHQKERL